MITLARLLAIMLKIIHSENMTILKCLSPKNKHSEIDNCFAVPFETVFKQLEDMDNEVDDGK